MAGLAVSLPHNMTIALVILRGIGEPPSKRISQRQLNIRDDVAFLWYLPSGMKSARSSVQRARN
jgi:hypothetical protein